MGNYLDIERLATLIRSKRGSRGLREVAQEIGNVSPSTLSRVENGKMPDMETFLALCDWLEVPPSQLFGTTAESHQDTAQAIVGQILGDKSLDPAIASVLAALIRAAYYDLRS